MEYVSINVYIVTRVYMLHGNIWKALHPRQKPPSSNGICVYTFIIIFGCLPVSGTGKHPNINIKTQIPLELFQLKSHPDISPPPRKHTMAIIIMPICECNYSSIIVLCKNYFDKILFHGQFHSDGRTSWTTCPSDMMNFLYFNDLAQLAYVNHRYFVGWES